MSKCPTVPDAPNPEDDDEPPGSIPGLAEPNPAITHSVVAFSLLGVSGRRRAAPPIPRFPVSRGARVFRARHYPQAADREWNDWRWQMRHRITSIEELVRVLWLSPDELDAVGRHSGPLPLALTPYYASLLSEQDASQPLRRTVVPAGGEYLRSPGEAEDPLAEDADRPVPSIVHRYPDRVLFLVTGLCSTYCRYCTRSRMVGAGSETSVHKSDLELGLAYIESHPEIRDVLLSGGDPLTLDDERLDWILARLRRMPHVEFIRVGTKQPVVMPQRITRELTRILRRHHPLWMSIHFTHPDELTPEVGEACARLADAGIPLGSQTVLLKGVNDDTDTMRRLMQGLLRLRVRPYYLYQCDPIVGSAHFRTPVSKGLEIIQGLRGHTTGYAVPTYVIDAPGGGGKIPLLPEYLLGREGDDLLLRNFEGGLYRYTDPLGGAADAPVEPCG
jgi:lysine 2,3-aminomutase